MQKRVTRIDIQSAAKVSGIAFILAGVMGSASYIVFAVLQVGGFGAIDDVPMGLVIAAPIIAGGIVGLWGITFGVIAALLFNATSRLTGGIEVELQDVPEPAP